MMEVKLVLLLLLLLLLLPKRWRIQLIMEANEARKLNDLASAIVPVESSDRI